MEDDRDTDLNSSRKRRRNAEDDDELSQGHAYSVINLYGRSRAILGNVHGLDSSFFPAANEADRKSLMLKSLYFEGMRSRKEQIDARAGSPKSVDWIWSTGFVDWLKGPENFFWITGRPGSGKSTLMKHIAESRKTISALQSDGKQWIAIHFFFDFRAANDLPNRVDGMLRSLLYQLMQRVPNLSSSFDADTFGTIEKSVSLQRCLDLVCDAVEATSGRVCAFIDGLDESANSGSELLEIFNILEDRAGIKICLASRPEPIFREEFSSVPSLVIQDHNHDSIRFYADYAFKNARLGPWARNLQKLSNDVQKKANGVFLWARLAVDELVQRFLEGKSDDELRQILHSMPIEIEAMYQRILDNLPAILQAEAAILLHLILNTSSKVEIRRLFNGMSVIAANCRLAEICGTSSPGEDLEHRLNATLGSLVDLHVKDYDEDDDDYVLAVVVTQFQPDAREFRVEVRLMHETLRTFLGSTDFLRKKLPATYETLYSDLPWIKLYEEELSRCFNTADLLHECDDEKLTSFHASALEFARGVTSDIPPQMVQILESWLPQTSLLLDALLLLPRELDIKASTEAYQLVEHILGHEFFALHFVLAICTYGRSFRNEYDHMLEIYLEQSNIACRNFILAVVHVIEPLALHAVRNIPDPAIQDMFDVLFDVALRDNFENSFGYGKFFDSLFARGATLGIQSLCNLFRSPQHYRISSLVVDFLRVKARRPGLVRTHIRCQEDADRCKQSFLKLWVELETYVDTPNRDATEQFTILLTWIQEEGLNVNEKFTEEGTVIHCLFENEFGLSQLNRHKYIRTHSKLLCLIRADIDPLIEGRHGSALETIRHYSKGLGIALAKAEDGDFDLRYCSAVEDTEYLKELLHRARAIQDVLQHYAENDGQWPTDVEARLLESS